MKVKHIYHLNFNQKWELGQYISYINLYYPISIFRILYFLKKNKQQLYLNFHTDYNYIRQEISCLQRNIIINFFNIHNSNIKKINTVDINSKKNEKEYNSVNTKKKEIVTNKHISNKSKAKSKQNNKISHVKSEDKQLEFIYDNFKELDTYNLYCLFKINEKKEINNDKSLKAMFRVIDKLNKLL